MQMSVKIQNLNTFKFIIQVLKYLSDSDGEKSTRLSVLFFSFEGERLRYDTTELFRTEKVSRPCHTDCETSGSLKRRARLSICV